MQATSLRDLCNVTVSNDCSETEGHGFERHKKTRAGNSGRKQHASRVLETGSFGGTRAMVFASESAAMLAR